jgi:LysR family transcriptional regulator AphB
MPRSLTELSDHDCIAAPTSPTGYTTWRLDGPEGEVEVAVRGRFHANSVLPQVDAALGGLGIALLPIGMTVAPVQSGQLQQVLPEYGRHRVGCYFVYLHRRQLPRAVSEFIEFTMAKLLDAHLVQPLCSAK